MLLLEMTHGLKSCAWLTKKYILVTRVKCFLGLSNFSVSTCGSVKMFTRDVLLVYFLVYRIPKVYCKLFMEALHVQINNPPKIKSIDQKLHFSC